MNYDLVRIKRKYSENLAHLCRKLFPSILEKEGLLLSILLKNFYPTSELYDDIVNNNLVDEFKKFIYSQVRSNDEKNENSLKSPTELLREAGYNLYLCKTQEEIDYFKKYYKKGEELCTFKDKSRIKNCYVFFAVKKDVDNIKREDFKEPKRQDLYGTSVISIQFDRDSSHRLSIKNRYNHTVSNPDATFSNNLDNIIPGLTKSFETYYGLRQAYSNTNLQIPNYVRVFGKYYKYNYIINNVYYCPDNIIIDEGIVKMFNKKKFLLIDYFILSLENDMEKGIWAYDDLMVQDSFPKAIGDIRNAKIEIIKKDTSKEIIITKENGVKIYITIDNHNQIIKFRHDTLEYVEDRFLYLNLTLKELYLHNVSKIGDAFLGLNQELEIVDLYNVREIGCDFLRYNGVVVKNLKQYNHISFWINSFLYKIDSISRKSKVKKEFQVEFDTYLFRKKDNGLKNLELPNVREIGDSFLHDNKIRDNFQNLISDSEKVKKLKR